MHPRDGDGWPEGEMLPARMVRRFAREAVVDGAERRVMPADALSLRPEQRVEFDVWRSPEGILYATNVRLIGDADTEVKRG